MSLYATWLERLFATSVLAALYGAAALFFCTRARVSPLAKVWVLRAALMGMLLSLLVGSLRLPILPSGEVATSEDGPLGWAARVALSLGMGIWFSGALVQFLRLAKAIRGISRLRRGLIPVAEGLIARAAGEAASRVGLARLPRLYRSPLTKSVVLVNGRRPAIVVPNAEIDPEHLRLALGHEIAHVKHADLRWAWLAALTETLLWFHPVVRLLGRRLHLWQEVSADAASLRRLRAEPRVYADMLLSFGLPEAAPAPLAAMSVASPQTELPFRLRALYDDQPPRAVAHAMAAALACVLLLPLTPVASKDVTARAPEENQADAISVVPLSSKASAPGVVRLRGTVVSAGEPAKD